MLDQDKVLGTWEKGILAPSAFPWFSSAIQGQRGKCVPAGAMVPHLKVCQDQSSFQGREARSGGHSGGPSGGLRPALVWFGARRAPFRLQSLVCEADMLRRVCRPQGPTGGRVRATGGAGKGIPRAGPLPGFSPSLHKRLRGAHTGLVQCSRMGGQTGVRGGRLGSDEARPLVTSGVFSVQTSLGDSAKQSPAG